VVSWSEEHDDVTVSTGSDSDRVSIHDGRVCQNNDPVATAPY